MANNTQNPEGETNFPFDPDFNPEDQKKLDESGAHYSYELNTGPGLIDGSNFQGKTPKQFDTLVSPSEPEKSEKSKLPKGSEYRKENNSSLL